jgi:hypothetical protein
MNKTKALFSSSNGVGRTVRTVLQSFVGVLAFAAAVIAVPQVQEFVFENTVVTAGSIATAIGVITGVQNALEKLLRDFFGE